MNSITGLLSKYSNAQIFLNYALSVYHFCKSLCKTPLCCSNGPLRVQLSQSLPLGLDWKIEDRHSVYSFLYLWNGIPSGEIMKTVQSIKDQLKKNEKQTEMDSLNQIFSACSTYSFSTLSRIGGLFLDNNIPLEALEWALKGEKTYNFCILRWLLSFHFEAGISLYINKAYQLLSSAQNNSELNSNANYYIHAIFDQFTAITSYDIMQSEIYEQYIRFIRTSERLAEIMPKREVQPLTQGDQIFSHIVSTNAGMLILFLFMNLIHPLSEIRQKSFKVITRLVCTNFGKDLQPKSEKRAELKKAFTEFEDSFQSQLPHSEHAAKLISKITATSCINYTESVFKESFYRIGRIQSQHLQLWLLDCCILPWCDNISLSASLKESTIPSYPPDEFLQNIYTHLSLNLVQFDCKLRKEIIQVWQRLSKSVNNHKMIVDFLLHQGISSQSNMLICKTLILYLFKDVSATEESKSENIAYSLASSLSSSLSGQDVPIESKQALLCDLIYPLSFFGVLGEEYTLWDSDTPSAETPRGGNVISDFTAHLDLDNKMLHESKLRQGVIEILINFIIDSIDLLLPHIHILLTWSLMLLNHSSASDYKILSKLLYTVLKTLKAILQTNNLNSKEITEKLEAVCKIFESDLPFRIIWNFDQYQKEPFIPLHHDYIYPISNNSLSKSNQCTLVVPSLPTSIFKNHHIQAPQLLHGSKIVEIIREFFEIINANDINYVWGSEVLKWAIHYKDPSISIICFEIYKSLRPVYIFDTPKLIIRCLTNTLAQLQKYIDQYFSVLNTSINLSPDEITNIKKKLTMLVVLSRGKLHEIMDALTLFIPNLIEENQIEFLCYIYWVLISIIRVSHPILEPLHAHTLKMINSLIELGVYNEKYSVTLNSQLQLLRKQPDWNYVSIEPYVIHYLYQPTTEKISLNIILNLLSQESLAITSPNHVNILLFGLVPWFHSKLLLFQSLSNTPTSSFVRFFISFPISQILY